MPRPRGANYAKNLKARIRAIEKAGFKVQPGDGAAAVPAVLDSDSSQEAIKAEVVGLERANRLGEQFLKSLHRINYAQKFREGIQGDKQEYVLYDQAEAMYGKGVLFRAPWRIRYDDLRMLSYNSSLVGAIHQVKSDDVRMHAQPSPDLGFKLRLVDEDAKSSTAIQADHRDAEELVRLMGTKDVPDWRSRERMGDVIEMATRDTLTIDKVAYLPTRNRRGQVIDVRYLDPATIFRVDPMRGYDGDRSIEYVQAIDMQVIETFKHGRLVVRSKNVLSDIRYRHDGFSPLESCVYEIMGAVYSLKHNMDKFNGRTPPSVLLTSKNKVNDEVLELFETMWESAFAGEKAMVGRIPFLYGVEDMQVHKLDPQTDMLYDKFMNWTAQLVLSRHGMDGAEIGLKFQQGQTLSEPSMDGRARFSRNRSHGAMMRFHQDCLNRVFEFEEQDPPRMLEFTGVLSEDKDKKLERDVKRLSSFMTLDEIRAEYDLPEMREALKKYYKDDDKKLEQAARLGGLVENQHYVQMYSQVAADQQQEGMDGGEDFGDAGTYDPEFADEGGEQQDFAFAGNDEGDGIQFAEEQ